MRLIVPVVLLLFAVVVGVPVLDAQTTVTCATDHTVIAGDWLSKLALAAYGDAKAYPRIVEATNAKTAEGYDHIADPNVIEIGWKLCIPPAEQTTNPPPAGDVINVSYDFRDGAQDWVAGFADYPPGEETFYELDSGIRDLPADIKPGGTAFFISGNNHSDDLYMFLKKMLDASDGIKPDTTYTLSFTIDVASNAPSGCFGVGGAPGEGVTLKAGGSAQEPKPVVVDDMYRLDVDKGIQTQAGPAGDVVGDIANGIECDDPANTPYVTLNKKHTSEFPIKSSPEGELWLLVGTDSGFEATTALYYEHIAVELTPQAK